jgi:hypothetical protein
VLAVNQYVAPWWQKPQRQHSASAQSGHRTISLLSLHQSSYQIESAPHSQRSKYRMIHTQATTSPERTQPPMRRAAVSPIAIEDIEYNLCEEGRGHREQSAGGGVCCGLECHVTARTVHQNCARTTYCKRLVKRFVHLLARKHFGHPIQIKYIPSLAFSIARRRSIAIKPIKPPGKNWAQVLEQLCVILLFYV